MNGKKKSISPLKQEENEKLNTKLLQQMKITLQ